MGGALIDSHIHFACTTRLPELVRYRERLGLESLGLLSLPDTRRVNYNPEVLFAKLRLPDACFAFASFDYTALFSADRDAPDLGAQVEAAAAIGFDGIKMWEGKPTFQQEIGLPLDDPVFAPAYRAAARLRMPVILHVADPPVFWDAGLGGGMEPHGTGGETQRDAGIHAEAAATDRPRFGWSAGAAGSDAGLPSFDELQAQTGRVLASHRETTFIFPHLLFRTQDLDAFTRFMDDNPNALLDLSPGLYFYPDLATDRDRARAFFDRFCTRILFGTDAMWFCRSTSSFPWKGLEENLANADRLIRFLSTEHELPNPFPFTREAIPTVRGLGLPEAVLEKLRRGTFRTLFGERPRPVDRTAAGEYLADFRASLAASRRRSPRGTTAADIPGGASLFDAVSAEVAIVENELER